jgi:hypothetical protein
MDPYDLLMEHYQYALRKWSNIVRIRDRFICQLCLNKFPSRLVQAHHIKPKADYPELAFDADNGICLCKKCHHRITHSDPRNIRRFVMLWWPYLNRKVVRLFNKTYQSRIDVLVVNKSLKIVNDENITDVHLLTIRANLRLKDKQDE